MSAGQRRPWRRTYPRTGGPKAFVTGASKPFVLIAIGLGLAWCFMPGLDAPNYHSALLMALPLSLAAGFASVFATARALAVPASGARSSPWMAALRAIALPSLLPLGILLANGVFVRQCDILAGVAFHLIGPVFSAFWAALLASALTCWAPPARRRRWGIASFLIVFLSWAVWDVAHIYRHPAIFVFNPFVGYLQGALYDSVVQIDLRIVLYRLNNAVQLASLLLVTRLCWDRTAVRARLKDAGRRAGLAVSAVFAVALSLAFFAARGEIGYEVTRAEVMRQLGGRIEDDRVILYFDRATISDAEAESLLEAHHFRIDQIEARLGAKFPRKIKSFVYGSVDRKRLLMGAAQVYIAKPWLEEIHLNRVAPGDPVIRHELAHVILGLFAPPPFHIPTRACVFPHMAVVEGAAESFEWDTGALTPHQWANAMRQAKKAADLRVLLDPTGFLGQGSDKAYTLVGSFMRYLADTYGVATLRDVYEDGDFGRAYGRPTEALVAEWEAFVDGLAVPWDAAGLATGRFSSVAVHRRPCGLDVARVEQEAGRLWGAAKNAEQQREARARYEQVVAWIPEDAQKRLALLRVSGPLGLPAVEAAYRDYLAAPQNHNAVSDALAEELLGDAMVRAGDIAGARDAYRRVSWAPLPEERRRGVYVKLGLAQDPERAVVLPYVVDGRREALAEGLLALPEDPIVAYLEARRLYNDRAWAEASWALAAVIDDWAGAATAEDRALGELVVRESLRLSAEARWQVGNLEGAASDFLALAELTPYGGDAERFRDRAEWARWKAARRSTAR